MDSVSQTGRATLGVRLMKMEEDTKVVTMATVEPEEDEDVSEDQANTESSEATDKPDETE